MFLFHMRYVSPGKGGIPILLPNKKGAACWSGSFFFFTDSVKHLMILTLHTEHEMKQ